MMRWLSHIGSFFGTIRLIHVVAVLGAVTMVAIDCLPALAQATSDLRSTLPTYPLLPNGTQPGPGSSACQLCWTPQQHATTDLPHHKRRGLKGTHPHKRPTAMHRFSRQSWRSHLPRYALGKLPQAGQIVDSWQVQVVDGDTLWYGQTRIRVRGLNAPELSEPGGHEAAQRLAQLLKEGPVKIIPHGHDVYGRTVADVFVDGRNVAEMLAEEGYAKPRS